MRIAEIFHSIQGEGELAGVPSVFVRTSGCNLRCAGCDTPYASWNPEGVEMTVNEIADAVQKHPSRHVVLTGGEPMISRGIRELAQTLRQLGKHITIETAGTCSPDGIACDLASVSPKFANSTPVPGSIDPAWIARHEESRLRPDVLAEWIRGGRYQIKLVVRTREDAQEAVEFLDASIPGIPRERIFLMPEGTEARTLAGRVAWLVEFSKQHGFRYCPRLHIELFGNARGT